MIDKCSGHVKVCGWNDGGGDGVLIFVLSARVCTRTDVYVCSLGYDCVFESMYLSGCIHEYVPPCGSASLIHIWNYFNKRVHSGNAHPLLDVILIRWSSNIH